MGSTGRTLQQGFYNRTSVSWRNLKIIRSTMIYILLVTFLLQQTWAACPEEKTVGDICYTRVDFTDTSQYGCIEGCTYKKTNDDESNKLFCFKKGPLPVSLSKCATGDEITPLDVRMSSTYKEVLFASYCIDGNTTNDKVCATDPHRPPNTIFPWITLVIPRSIVKKIRITNPDDSQWGDNMENMKIWVGEEFPSTTEMEYAEGALLGTFAGPGRLGEVVEITSNTEVVGTHVVVQMKTQIISLSEIEVFGELVPDTGSARRCGSNIVNYVRGEIENQEFSMDNMHCDPTSGEKCWLTPSQYTGEAFVAELESTIPVIGVRLRNTHKLQDKDRATKKFRVSIGSSNEGPWTELLTQELEDSRNQEVPPLQHFESNNAISGRFLQFELLEFWGDGGGLNYFDIIQEVTVGSPISFIEDGEEHKQNMTITKIGGKHILTVTIPAPGIFKATTVLITEDTNKGNSKSEDNTIFIMGNQSAIMELPSELQALHEIFDAAHNYNGTLRRRMETKEHAFLVHEASLSVEEVEALDPAIRSFVQTGSVSRVTSRKVTEDHFETLNKGTSVPIPPHSSNDVHRSHIPGFTM